MQRRRITRSNNLTRNRRAQGGRDWNSRTQRWLKKIGERAAQSANKVVSVGRNGTNVKRDKNSGCRNGLLYPLCM